MSLYKQQPAYYIICVNILIFFFSAINGYSQSSDDLFLRTYYERLGDISYTTRNIPGNLENALKAYQNALKYGKYPHHVYWKLSRIYWTLAQRFSEPSIKIEHLKKSYIEGKKAVRKDPENSKSHLWYALSLGSLAVESGVMKKISTKDDIKKALQKSLKLNNKEIRAILGLASWYFHVPEFFGGNRKQAYRLIEKALQIDPNFTATHKVKAGFYLREERLSEARLVLQKILGIKAPTSKSGGIEDKAIARDLLKKISAKSS